VNSLATNNDIESVERQALRHPQADCPVTHRFAPGIYVREVIVPRGTFIIGHAHKTECLNMLIKGRIRVMIDGVVTELTAPFAFNSAPGVRKVAYALEETIWANVHPNPTDTQNLEQLEAMFIEKSTAYLEHEMKTLIGGAQ
jgi:hypothetical protein